MSILRRNNVRVTGATTGRPVVLVHGFGCDQNMWRLVEPLLAEDHPLVLFDYVGAGRSDLSAWQEDRYSSSTATPATWSRSARSWTCATRSSSATR